jgi:hypothetical protein
MSSREALFIFIKYIQSLISPFLFLTSTRFATQSEHLNVIIILVLDEFFTSLCTKGCIMRFNYLHFCMKGLMSYLREGSMQEYNKITSLKIFISPIKVILGFFEQFSIFPCYS